MISVISSCGIVCSECRDFPDVCSGCPTALGKPYWVKEVGITICPLYACCADDRNLDDCGLCADFPCPLYFELKDPSLSDEEHRQGIRDRAEILRSRHAAH